MKTIDYNTAVNTRFDNTKGVRVFVFKQLKPPCCRNWEEEILEPIALKYNMFDWNIVFTDRSHNVIPFPPSIKPTFYFVCPDAEQLHFIRTGEVSFEQLDAECEKFLRIHNGEYYSDVFR